MTGARGLPADLEALPEPVLPRLPPRPRLLLGLGLLPLLGLLVAFAGLDAADAPCPPQEAVDYTSGAHGAGGGCGAREAAARGAPALGTGLAASSIAWVDRQAGRRGRWLLALEIALAAAGVTLAVLAAVLRWPEPWALLAPAGPLAALAALALARTVSRETAAFASAP